MSLTNSVLIAGVTEIIKHLETTLFGADSKKISGITTVLVAVVIGLIIAAATDGNFGNGVINAVAAVTGMTTASKVGGN